MKTCLLILLLQSVRIIAADDVVTLTYPGSAKAGELACEANYFLWLPPARASRVSPRACKTRSRMRVE